MCVGIIVAMDFLIYWPRFDIGKNVLILWEYITCTLLLKINVASWDCQSVLDYTTLNFSVQVLNII